MKNVYEIAVEGILSCSADNTKYSKNQKNIHTQIHSLALEIEGHVHDYGKASQYSVLMKNERFESIFVAVLRGSLSNDNNTIDVPKNVKVWVGDCLNISAELFELRYSK